MIYPWQQDQWQSWLAQFERLGHAYLLTGSTGLGLTVFAQTMAQSLFCQRHDACGQCSGCRQFLERNHIDFFQLEVLEGKKEVGVEQVRQLTQKLMQTSYHGGYKVALLPEVERFNTSAFNALLKTLEEPPQQTLLILTSYQRDRLPATIVSRCQQIAFSAPVLAESEAWLAQQIQNLSPQLCKRALRLNWGAPLAALDWLNNQAWLLDEAWQANLTELVKGQTTPSNCAGVWLKWPCPEKVFDQFYLLSVNAIRRGFYQQQPLNPNWFSFQQQILQAKLDWQGNANKELLLESLCLLYLALQSDNSLTIPTIFTDTRIRGRL
ncbi:AAA family ATPase [Thiomicrospira microaerophila]|uniref:AAA family ATPase n=1 Tax=Thiomicrospira microaerophila TaxID=406020 RepID=UPI00200CCF3A|nr:AAA family ATPase [Thiomicrospira microaerophila]UQB42985.1 AAA family ATPase [Thiomicrospira microaerophila]